MIWRPVFKDSYSALFAFMATIVVLALIFIITDSIKKHDSKNEACRVYCCSTDIVIREGRCGCIIWMPPEGVEKKL